MSADAFLKEWTQLTTELTQLVETALDVEPPGECPDAWKRWLTRFGVARLDDDTRYELVRADGQTKGAPLKEVEGCLQSLAREASVPGELEDQGRALESEVLRAIEVFEEETQRKYRARLTELAQAELKDRKLACSKCGAALPEPAVKHRVENVTCAHCQAINTLTRLEDLKLALTSTERAFGQFYSLGKMKISLTGELLGAQLTEFPNPTPIFGNVLGAGMVAFLRAGHIDATLTTVTVGPTTISYQVKVTLPAQPKTAV